MAVVLHQQMMSALPELRFQPTPKRVRVRLGDVDVVDTQRAVLVWEPRRIVPSYAVPERDVSVELVAAATTDEGSSNGVAFGDGPPVLDPSVPFRVHTAAGAPLDVVTPTDRRAAAAFRLGDDQLTDYVVLDFNAFDWREEDEPIVGHARDPFHRIDVRRSSRRVRVELDDQVLAESDRCQFLFEGVFPIVRHYMPPDDVQVELVPGPASTTCAYKGRATHYTARLDDRELIDIAWSYEEPLEDARNVRGLVCFYEERLDVSIDGSPVERVRTPWS